MTFSPTNIEICPVPTIAVITDKDDGTFDGMSDATFPDANHVVFVCVDFPVTDGLKGQVGYQKKKGSFIVNMAIGFFLMKLYIDAEGSPLI